MKRLRVPGIANIIKVDDPEEIRALARDPRIDRNFELRTCPFNWLLLKRSLIVLSVKDRRFPTMTRRDSQERQLQQQALANSLTAKAAAVRLGPEELDPLARWIRGEGPDSEVGILTQQLLGRLFSPAFVATDESWAAAKIFVAAPRSPKIAEVFWWFVSGKVRRSKRLLAQMANEDLSAMNAIGIAVHNVVKGLRQMRRLYADPGIRSTLSPNAAASQCLFAPVSLYRQATDAGQVGDCPFQRNSLFVLEIGKASRQEAGRPFIFMDGTWSRCPAADWVPAMLEGLWFRSTNATSSAETGDAESND
jgi:hypothetical protein